MAAWWLASQALTIRSGNGLLFFDITLRLILSGWPLGVYSPLADLNHRESLKNCWAESSNMISCSPIVVTDFIVLALSDGEQFLNEH